MAKVRILRCIVEKLGAGRYNIIVRAGVFPETIGGQKEVRIDGTLRITFYSKRLGYIRRTINVTRFGEYTVVFRIRDRRPPGRYDSEVIAELNGYTMILKGMGLVATRSRDVRRFIIALTPPKGERKYRIPSPPRELRPVYGGVIHRRYQFMF